VLIWPVSIDRIEPAYELAEHHRDFPTLVWLCHYAVAGAGAARLQGYIEKFGEEFAFVLYQWHIDQRK
jgi:nuclear pore complex protein Nup133